VLSIGLQAGLLDTRMYSLLVVMAIVTTGMAGPLLNRTEKTIEIPTIMRDGLR